MSDPVAEKSGFLCMYMSSHPDTLVAYAKWFGKVKEHITGAQMTGITTKNITLACTFKDGSKKEVIVPIEPPLKGYDDVKPRLLEMKAIAQEGLGMIKAPRLDSFVFPRKGVLGATIFVAAGVIAHWAPSESTSPLLYPVAFLRQHLGEKALAFNFWALFTAHVFESLYTLSLCYKHSTPFFVGLQYVGATLVLGYPIWSALRKRIQNARIESVMKIE
ncbi:hypothetical protein DFP72DRAFT_272778 [Ephemerocybe angulata]|uniref:DUF2470 domain-containing protein n=1 Tax=Ephemerocybe angulata TaxID=980116 RepID=A0A8H6I0U6_9AGAR|nr:hypothetical protein DFP72DRAFT_272778 [Tulosesus angulatus]